MQGLFITGTDTAVGKTWTACALIRAGLRFGLRMGAYKPACSGAEIGADGRPRWEDLEALAGALGSNNQESIGPQRFLAPLAPPLAAAAEGKSIDRQQLFTGAAAWTDRCDVLIVEGAGGFLCPLTEDLTFADLALQLGVPVLVVAANRLGVINHTLLTLEAIARRGLRLRGVVLCDVQPVPDASADLNAAALQRYAKLPWLGRIRHGESVIQARDAPLTEVDFRSFLK